MFGIFGGLATIAQLGLMVWQAIFGGRTQSDDSQLLSAIKELSVQLEAIRRELGDIDQELKKIDQLLGAQAQSQFLIIITTLRGVFDSIVSLTPPPKGEPIPDSWHDYADAIMGLGGTPSVDTTMHTIHNLLTQRVWTESFPKLSWPALLWIRAQLILGLHLLAFGCVYARSTHDFGYFSKRWSQKLHEQLAIQIQNYQGADFVSKWGKSDFNGQKLYAPQAFALDNIFLHQYLQPAYRKFGSSMSGWLCTSKDFGNLKIRGVIFGYSDTRTLTFSADDKNVTALEFQLDASGKCIEAKGIQYPKAKSPLDPPPLKQKTWYVDLQRGTFHYLPEAEFSKEVADTIAENIGITYDVNGTAATDSPLSLGSAYGQTSVLSGKDSEALLCIFNDVPIDPEDLDRNLLTYREDSKSVEWVKLRDLHSLTSAQWRVRYDESKETYKITPLAATESPPPHLIFDPNKYPEASWALSTEANDEANFRISRPPWANQPMGNPLDMKPIKMVVTNGQATADVPFISAPYDPVLVARLKSD